MPAKDIQAAALEFVPDHAGGSRQGLPAFDLLCVCKKSDGAKFVCIYGDNPLDQAAVEHLATMFPLTRLHIRGADHNAINAMWKRGTLRRFYRQQFAFERIQSLVLLPAQVGH